MSVGNIRKLQENTAALYTERKTLQVSVIKRSRYVYPEKLKRPPLPSGCEISGCKMSAHGIPPRGPLSRMTRSAQGYPAQLHPDSQRGYAPSCYPEQLHPDDSISYPDMLSGWKTLTIVSKLCYSPRSAALQWCVRMPCPDIFAMDSKGLSSISDCFGDKKAPTRSTILCSSPPVVLKGRSPSQPPPWRGGGVLGHASHATCL
uniref:Uncharacterized protein n=1 Tax=Vitis vinifera TaxID=29760 RepID=A5AJH1_VITVI|nr:hypothetical protein VITISV_030753 [Vitis vinifera]